MEPNIPQQMALLELSKSQQNGKNKSLVVLPSGIGKTHLSAFETKKINGKILYLAHRYEILDQAKDVFKTIHKISEDDMGFYRGSTKQIGRKIIFAMMQTIGKEHNLFTIDKNYFEYIILDEYHHVATKTYQRILKHFKPKHLLGLTATPFRGDAKDILGPIDYNVPYQMDLQEGLRSGVLVPFIYYGLWDDVDYSNIYWNGTRYKKSDLNKALLIDARDDAIIEETKKKLKNRKSIGFCVSVKHVERCVQRFNEAGIKAIGLSYYISIKKRREIIKDFKDGKYQIIFTRDIFNEGINFPDVEGLLFLRPTWSKTVFYQQLGRGLRKCKGKKNVIVLDFIGNYMKANQLKVWLKEIISQGNIRDKKPEYEHTLSEVIFDEKVIELFDNMGRSHYNREFLIQQYEDIKMKIGRIPSTNDMERHGQTTLSPYITWWGSWSNFKKVMHDETQIKTKEFIKEKILTFYNEYHRLPTRKDEIEKRITGISNTTIFRIFGTKTECLLYCGLKRENKSPYTREMLIKHYVGLKERLGRLPTGADMNKSGGMTVGPYVTFWGSWTEFKKEMGDEQKRYTKEDIKKAFIRFYKKHGIPPTTSDMNASNNLPSSGVVERLFGPINNCYEYCNFKPHRIKYSDVTKEQIIKDYLEAKKRLGRRPRIDSDDIKTDYYFRKHMQIKFGSTYKFLKEINEPLEKIIRAKDISKQEFIENYLWLKKNLDLATLPNGINKNGLMRKDGTLKMKFLIKGTGSKYPHWLYKEKFGSWKNFLIEANEIKAPLIVKKELLIEDYFKTKKKLGKKLHASEIECGYNIYVYLRKFFGNYDEFLKEINEYEALPTKDDLIMDYHKKYEKLGRKPKWIEIDKTRDRIRRLFGSYSKFIEIAEKQKPIIHEIREIKIEQQKNNELSNIKMRNVRM